MAAEITKMYQLIDGRLVEIPLDFTDKNTRLENTITYVSAFAKTMGDILARHAANLESLKPTETTP